VLRSPRDFFEGSRANLFGSFGFEMSMTERRTLQMLAWSVGGLVGALFLLNAFALATQF
jgi:hypothetical protein